MQDYYGWRARIGLIYIADSTVMEPELYAMAPEGVSIHTARIDLADPSAAGLASMMAGDEVEGAARLLGKAPLHVVTFGGTTKCDPCWRVFKSHDTDPDASSVRVGIGRILQR